MISELTNLERRAFLKRLGLGAAASLSAWSGAGAAMDRIATSGKKRSPNIVILFADDVGYGDVGVFGARDYRTPRLDRMAAEGARFTDFYVAQPVCGASRASLLTGCYANRIGLAGAPCHTARHGIHPDETTLGELVKSRDYATAVFGKWHLGHRPPFLPTRNGFDEYFGLPYSNDMWPYHPTARNYFTPVPLMEGEEVIALNPDMTRLTKWYTDRAVRFIERNRERPFLLYVAYSMAHVPLFATAKHRGESGQGLYGDVMEEIDASAGTILDTLARCGIDDDTLVIFTSDNGPWLSYGNHGGSAGPLREGKGTTWEGGVREPFIARWPGKIPAGHVCREPAMTIDLFPTVARLTGARLPDRKIDGMDIWPLLTGEPGAKSPHEAFYFYYHQNDFEAMRSGKWKLVFPHRYHSLTGTPGMDGRPAGYTQAACGLELYDLENDIGETRNVIDAHPEVRARLEALAEKAREDLGDRLTKREGKNRRPAGRV